MSNLEHQCVSIQNGGTTYLTNVIRNGKLLPWKSKFVSKMSLAEKTIIWDFVRAVVSR